MPPVESAGYFVPGLHESMPETKAVPFSDDETGFFDQLLDIINPLQHIPVVSTVYRALSGDQIAGPARLIGGALFGGPVGLATATANLLLEDATGNDLAGHALALVGGNDDAGDLAEAAVPVAAFAPSPAAAEPAAAITNPARPAASLAVADDGSAIIWNGPRVLPSLARTAPVPRDAAAADTPPPDVAAQPAWLGAAISDAQAVQDAAQLGQAAQKVDGQPWVSEAMLDALNKYEAMARARNQ